MSGSWPSTAVYDLSVAPDLSSGPPKLIPFTASLYMEWPIHPYQTSCFKFTFVSILDIDRYSLRARFSASTNLAIVKHLSSGKVYKHRVAVGGADNVLLTDLRKQINAVIAQGDSLVDAEENEVDSGSEKSIKLGDVLKDGVLHISAALVEENVLIPVHVSRPDAYTNAQAPADSIAVNQAYLNETTAKLFGNGNNAAPKDFKTFNELTAKERKELADSAYLGFGLVLSDENPRRSAFNSIDPTSITDLLCTPTNTAAEEVKLEYLARVAAYARAGWAKIEASVSTSFVSGGLDASFKASSSSEGSTQTLHVCERYIFSQCTVTLGSREANLKPSAGLKAAIDKALQQLTPAQKTVELTRVCDKYGHVYPTSVELGAMPVTSKTVQDVEDLLFQHQKSSLEAGMQLAIGKKFGPSGNAQVAAGGGYSIHGRTCSDIILRSVSDVDTWKTSLWNRRHWAFVRVSDVDSIINLLDSETQAKVLEAAPAKVVAAAISKNKTPIYELKGTLNSYYIRAPLPEGTLQFTIVAWARQAAHKNGWATITSIENWDWTISTIVWLGVANAEGGDLKVDLPNNIGNDPDWMHAALVYDVETRKIRLFSNRVDVDHIDLSDERLHLLSSVNNPLLVVGRNKHEHKRGCAFDGQIGEVRVFQEALDALKWDKKLADATKPKESGYAWNDGYA
ncbi:hypothetical protein M422DRAFT_67812 [Sphaerobolus stellatus SS14]|uniref:MACPF-like domain-containing protein n=1 Tax=Sphaerobolus stellatus (strain SS14) TaxID=990650 RepID=A0A0C9ULM0_SPHS4|nr:hypothetical protein M422DRAFT_67812 [Sphaerobolus stellatus SS14]